MRTPYGDDGLGLDLTPILQAAQTTANIYGQVEASRHPVQPASLLPPVVNVTGPAAPAGGGGGGNKTLTYLVVGMALLGGGFIAWRAFGPRRR